MVGLIRRHIRSQEQMGLIRRHVRSQEQHIPVSTGIMLDQLLLESGRIVQSKMIWGALTLLLVLLVVWFR